MFPSSGQNHAAQSSFVTDVSQAKYEVKEVLMTVTTKSIVICNVKPFNFMDVNQKCKLSLIIGEHATLKRRYTYIKFFIFMGPYIVNIC